MGPLTSSGRGAKDFPPRSEDPIRPSPPCRLSHVPRMLAVGRDREDPTGSRTLKGEWHRRRLAGRLTWGSDLRRVGCRFSRRAWIEDWPHAVQRKLRKVHGVEAGTGANIDKSGFRSRDAAFRRGHRRFPDNGVHRGKGPWGSSKIAENCQTGAIKTKYNLEIEIQILRHGRGDLKLACVSNLTDVTGKVRVCSHRGRRVPISLA